MPHVNLPDPTSGPTNGPPAHEPPRTIDGVIEVLKDLNTAIDDQDRHLKGLKANRERLQEILQSAMVESNVDQVFDPATGTTFTVNFRNLKCRDAISVTSEPCGLSRTIYLSDDQRAKLAEILGNGPAAKSPPDLRTFADAKSADLQSVDLRTCADGPAPPKVTEEPIDVERVHRALEASRPELERTLEALEKAKHVSREVMERFVGQPTELPKVAELVDGGHDGEAMTVEPEPFRVPIPTSAWPIVRLPGIDPMPVERPRPVVSPAFGGPPHAE